MKNLKIIKKLKEIRKKKYKYVRISLNESIKIKKLKEEIYLSYKNLKKKKLQKKLLDNEDTTLGNLKKFYHKKKLYLKDKKFIEKMYHSITQI